MLGREAVGAIFAVILGDDLDDGEDEGDQGVLKDGSPGALVTLIEFGRQ